VDGEARNRRRLVRAIAPCATSLTAVALLLVPSGASARGDCIDGAAGAGDPYYPTAGNGGYNARHYDLDLSYDPATGVLDARRLLICTGFDVGWTT
jgi:hypothetical protein